MHTLLKRMKRNGRDRETRLEEEEKKEEQEEEEKEEVCCGFENRYSWILSAMGSSAILRTTGS